MQENLVSGALTDADLQEIHQAVALIRERMPFLIDLSTDEKRALALLGERSEGFVRKAREVANANPGMLPAAFDLDEMNGDLELYGRLQGIRTRLVQLLELVEDTSTGLGADILQDALAVYRFAKFVGAEGLDELRDEMAQRFNRVGPSTPGTRPAAGPVQPATP